MSPFRRLLTLSFLSVGPLAVGACASAPVPATSKVTEAPFHVGVTALSFTDAARQRPVATTLWYPVSRDTQMAQQPAGDIFAPYLAARDAGLSDAHPRYPVVLMSHGSGGRSFNLAWLGTHLAAHGFLVVAVDHAGNMAGDNSPEGYVRGWERPRDFTFVLDALLKDAAWGPRLDPERIGSAGHSMGGYTALALVGARLNLGFVARVCTAPETRDHPGCELLRDVDYSRIDLEEARASYKDPRVRAAFAMAPGMAGTYAARDVADIQRPVELVAAKGDELMPHAQHALHLARLLPRAKLVTLEEAGHFTFLPECTPLGFKVTPELCRDAEEGTRAASHERTRQEALDFFTRSLGPAPAVSG